MRASLIALLVGDARLLDLLAGGDLGCSASVSRSARSRASSARWMARLHLHVALLIEAGGLALALNVEGLLLGLQVAAADADHRVLLDVVAELAPVLDLTRSAWSSLPRRSGWRG